jgi:membrane peptidoglycan carboxypeptidase
LIEKTARIVIKGLAILVSGIITVFIIIQAKIKDLFLSSFRFGIYLIKTIYEYGVGIIRQIITIINFFISRRANMYYAFSIILGVICASYLYFTLSTLPSPQSMSDFSLPATTQMYDRNGILLYSTHADINRVPVRYEQLPQTLIDATLAAEDKKFYSHRGFDIRRIIRATHHNLIHQDVQSASTITQQLAKNVFLTPERTMTRKLKEAIITMRIEANFDKKQILELYFNTISYGGNTQGVESAAQKYFGKSVSELSKKESIFLASLPVAPTVLLYNPQKDFNPEKRMEYILSSMEELGTITPEEKNQIQNEPLSLLPPMSYKRAPSFVDYVLAKLEEKYGKEYVLKKGLIVKTSLDLKLQNHTQKELLNQLIEYNDTNITNGAVLVIDPHNGDILTMIGSARYYEHPHTEKSLLAEEKDTKKIDPFITITDSEGTILYEKEYELLTTASVQETAAQTVSQALSETGSEGILSKKNDDLVVHIWMGNDDLEETLVQNDQQLQL